LILRHRPPGCAPVQLPRERNKQEGTKPEAGRLDS